MSKIKLPSEAGSLLTLETIILLPVFSYVLLRGVCVLISSSYKDFSQGLPWWSSG